MKRNQWMYLIIGVLLGLTAAVLWSVFRPQTSVAPTVNTTSPTNTNSTTTVSQNTNSIPTAVTFTTADLPNRDSHFAFEAEIPLGWIAEYVSGSQSINLYDPNADGVTALDQSKIFVKYFVASDFQTLTTVDIQSRTASTINNRPAVTYIIKKKTGVADFADQPSWRNEEHTVTDIRSTDDSPTTFYVFAKAPDISDEVFQDFLDSVSFLK